MRPNLDDMLNHEFLNHGGQIPKTLPQAFMACPPTAKYVRDFMPNGYQLQNQQNYASAAYLPRRLEQTAPADPMGAKRTMSGTGSLSAANRMAGTQQTAGVAGNLVFTDRVVFNRKE